MVQAEEVERNSGNEPKKCKDKLYKSNVTLRCNLFDNFIETPSWVGIPPGIYQYPREVKGIQYFNEPTVPISSSTSKGGLEVVS